MIFKETSLFSNDNSGALLMKCIHVFSKKKIAFESDIVLVTIKKCKPRRKIKKGSIFRGVVVKSCFCCNKRLVGFVKFMDNRVVLLKKGEKVPLGTRVIGSVSFILRKKGFIKLISLASFLV